MTALLDAVWAEDPRREPERATDLGLDTGAKARVQHRLADVSRADIEVRPYLLGGPARTRQGGPGREVRHQGVP